MIVKLKDVGKKIFITLISTFIFYLVGRYWRLDTGIHDSFVYFQYPILCIISILFGPISGLITGFVGHCLIDIANDTHIWFNWAISSGFLGFSLGFISKYWLLKNNPHPLRELIPATRVKYGIVIFLTTTISFLFLAPILGLSMYPQTDIRQLMMQAVFATLSDGLISVVVTDLFFSSFKHTILRRTIAIITLLNALILVSYGNTNIGSIILYIITIFFGLYLFFYKKWHFKSKYKWIEILKKCVFVGFMVYACEILFLACTAYSNKPDGNEKICIVLGAGLNGTQPSSILQMRLDRAYEWLSEDDSRIVITSGGQGSDEVISEGEAMRNYLIAKGIDESRVIAECKSTTTEENFEYSLQIIESNNLNYEDNIIFVTNSFHCYRAGKYAKRAGFTDARALAAPTPVTGIIPNYLREGLAFVKYLLV